MLLVLAPAVKPSRSKSSSRVMILRNLASKLHVPLVASKLRRQES